MPQPLDSDEHRAPDPAMRRDARPSTRRGVHEDVAAESSRSGKPRAVRDLPKRARNHRVVVTRRGGMLGRNWIFRRDGRMDPSRGPEGRVRAAASIQ